MPSPDLRIGSAWRDYCDFRLTRFGHLSRGAPPTVYPSQSTVSDRNRPDRIGVSEPPGCLSARGNPRVSEASGGDRQTPESSKGSQVQILSARPVSCVGTSFRGVSRHGSHFPLLREGVLWFLGLVVTVGVEEKFAE